MFGRGKILKLRKSCSNCIKGTGIAVNNDILCRENGAVSPDYVCSKHRSMPVQKSFKEQNYKCIKCELSEWLGSSLVFEINHIDGNNSNDDNRL